MRYNFTERMPELLAPAGSFACLKAAVQNGADAVYLGLKTGSARMGAENFTLPELTEAVRYAHIRGVRVYLALNTLLYAHEMDAAYETAREAVQAGVDALILQDLGLAARISRNRGDFPCELHASTQMSVYNEAGLKFLKELGFDRCITARELSVSELEQLCAAKILEVEAFCHGALCMSLSGQCLLSSFIGGRSGNRGTCAQPCRKKYALTDSAGSTSYAYRLSPSDFASLPHMQALLRAGIHSFKIEGRLKSPAYVAMTTRYYRQAIDGCLEDLSGKMHELRLLFGRGAFTSGYLFGKLPFRDLTFRSAGRLGIPIGRLLSFPKKLPAPKDMPRNLIRFRFPVCFDAQEQTLRAGDGITIYDTGAETLREAGGGTVNAVQAGGSPGRAEITVVGSLGAPGTGPYLLSLTSDSRFRAAAETAQMQEQKKIPILVRFRAYAGRPPLLEMEDLSGNRCVCQAEVPAERAATSPASDETVRRQLAKLGDTPYRAERIEVVLDDGLFLPVSVLNTLRRDCVEQLSALRAARRGSVTQAAAPPAREAPPAPAPGGISLFFYRLESFLSFGENTLPEILHPYRQEARTYYVPMEAFYADIPALRLRLEDRITALRSAGDCKILAYFPYILLGDALADVRKQLPALLRSDTGLCPDGFLCENPGDLALLNALLRECPAARQKLLIACDYSFNAANAEALRLLGRMGANRAALSPEAAPDCMSAAASVVNPELVAGGRIILMRSRHCYIDEGTCGGRKAKCMRGNYALKDAYGCVFPILAQKRDCCSILLSHKPVSYSAAQLRTIRSACPEVTLRVNVE